MLLGAPLAVALVAALAMSPTLDRRLTTLTHPDLVGLCDTPYGRTVVTERLGQVVVYQNDTLAYESQGTAAEEFVQLAALQVPEVRSVLVMGGAVEGLAGEAAKNGPRRLVDVELDKELLETVRPWLPRESQAALLAPAVAVVVADPRLYLKQPQTYDLILAAMPEPESCQANRYYTREFFEACRDRLAPGGVLGFRLRGAENLWTPALTRRAASIHRALRSVFADVLVLPGATNLVLASSSPLARDPEVLVSRWEARAIRARLVGPAYIRYLYSNDRFAGVAAMLSRTSAPENVDARPICYQYTLLIWLSRFFPVLALLDLWGAGEPSASVPLAMVLLALMAGTFALVRRSDRSRRVLLVGVAGCLGMVLEGALILGYQVRRGVLFQDLGLLLMLFMAGLAAGSLALDRLDRRARGAGLSRRAGFVLLIATTTACLVAAQVLSSSAGLLGTGSLLLATGILVGGVFSFASLRGPVRQLEAVAPLYGADLLGGCLGSLVGSLLLFPVLGLPGALLSMGGLALAACLLV